MANAARKRAACLHVTFTFPACICKLSLLHSSHFIRYTCSALRRNYLISQSRGSSPDISGHDDLLEFKESRMETNILTILYTLSAKAVVRAKAVQPRAGKVYLMKWRWILLILGSYGVLDSCLFLFILYVLYNLLIGVLIVSVSSAGVDQSSYLVSVPAVGENRSSCLSSLHWFPVHFKILLFVCKSLKGLAPSFLSELLRFHILLELSDQRVDDLWRTEEAQRL